MKKLLPLFGGALALLLLSACAAAPPPAQPTAAPPTATLTPSPTPAPPAETPGPTAVPPAPPIERVLIVSFDGMRPDAIAAAEMDNTLSLMKSGAYTLTARTVFPPTTLPAHASMLVGTCPAKHIVRWNEFVPENGYAIGTDIFDLAHAAGLQTVMIVGKHKLSQITEPGSLDYYAFIDENDKIADPGTIENVAVQQVKNGFNLMFIHFPDGDLAGHEYGWNSKWQLLKYARDDKKLGLILDALKAKGMYDSTIIIVTSDHGGHGTTHGEDVPEDMTIPWIISGPRVQPGELRTQVNTMDTAATAAFALGLPLPPEWDGAPALEAFGLPITAFSKPCH